MSRRSVALSTIVGLVAAVSLAIPVLAKEGAEARLDTALPRDAEPGSTVKVGWSVFSVDGDQMNPIYGSPIYIRLVGLDATSATEVMGTEVPRGSGHYTASIQVPEGGIGEVIVGMVGESCVDGGACQRSDMIFPLTDDPLASGAGPVAAPAPATPATSATSIGGQLVPIIGIGVAVAIVGGLAALIVGRRRIVEAPAGRGPATTDGGGAGRGPGPRRPAGTWRVR